MSDVMRLRRAPAGWLERRRRTALLLRRAGVAEPGWWELAFVVLVLVAAVGVPLYGVLWVWSRVGWPAALLLAGLLGYLARAGLLRRRAVLAHRRRAVVRYSLADIDAADPRGYRRIVGRLLQRDGWQHVRGVRVLPDVVHLVGVDAGGRQLGVAFERTDVDAGGTSAAVLRVLRPVVEEPTEPEHGQPVAPLLLVVSRGQFDRERVVWAARTGVTLVDRDLLARWAAGEELPTLLDA